jgi:hypothetical protein
MNVDRLYTPHVVNARERFAAGAAAALCDPNMDPLLLELFCIHYCSRGVQMTKPVESWIFRAGEQCERVGLPQVGKALKTHSRHEADHHLMMIDDTKQLVGFYNHRYRPSLDVSQLIGTPATTGIRAYVELHEDTIASDAPYGQMAIEYEIEGLSVSFVPGFLQQCKRLLGSAVTEKLSFLVEHMEIDTGHTKFNESQLEKLIAHDPSFASPLARAGVAALDAYGAFLAECLAAAKQSRKLARVAEQASHVHS